MWEINGLPLHPLIVHAAVVFGPLAALAAIAYSVWGSRRDQLRWPTLFLVVIAFASIWAAWLSGDNFLEHGAQFQHMSGKFKERVEHHEELAGTLRWVTTGFSIVTVISVFQHARDGGLRALLSMLVVVSAVATLVYVALTGDAGARSVWGA